MNVEERLVPARDHGKLAYVEHLARYYFASQFVQNKRVLDIVCGSGFGSKILVEAGAQLIIGADQSIEAVEYAKDNFKHDRCEFMVADAMTLSDDLKGKKFNAIVSFETNEHIQAPNQFLREVLLLLEPSDSLFVVSSPNKLRFQPGNPHHLSEMTPPELEEMLKRYFREVRLLSQTNWIASSVHEQVTDFSSAHDFRFSYEPKEQDALYMIAVCTNGELPNIRGRCVLDKAGEIESLRKEILHRESLLSQLRSSQAPRAMRVADHITANLQMHIETLEKEVATLRQELMQAHLEFSALRDLIRSTKEGRVGRNA